MKQNKELEKLKVLLIEDNDGDAELVREMLHDAFDDAIIHHGTSIQSAKKILQRQHDINIILLDINLPDSNGLETVRTIHDSFASIPIIVLTGVDSETLSLSAIQSGAQDYLIKSQFSEKALAKTIMYAIKRHKAFEKINESSEVQKKFFNTHDVLTLLPNQQLFLEKLHITIHKHFKTKQSFSMLLLKIREITKVTIELGHVAKDTIIKKISRELVENINKSTFIARYNEDTFALLLTETQGRTHITKEITAIQHALATAVSIADQSYFPSYNIGMAAFPFDGEDSEILIKSAYAALDRAMLQGIKTYESYSKDELYAHHKKEQPIWHSDLQFALDKQEFFLMYQPILELDNEKLASVEALLRWQHPTQGLIPPSTFIPVAEDSHLITAIGYWVLDTACRQFCTWRTEYQFELAIHINVSAQQLQYANLVSTIKKLLHRYEIPAYYLTIEVTESIFIDRPEIVIEKLNQLKQIGIQIALDDFGRGYSSLNYLSHLPIDKLKLDLDFVQKIEHDLITQVIVRSTVELGHSLDLDIIAEGVETQKQMELLKQDHCDAVQGYYFSKPLSADGIVEFIRDNPSRLIVNS